MYASCRFVSGAMFVLSIAGALYAGPPHFEPTYLGPGRALAMNESAVAVGTDFTSGQRAWVANPVYRLLPIPQGMQSSVANDVNEHGQVVGAIGPGPTVEFGGKAALWTPDGRGGYTVEMLSGRPGEVASLATAMNNIGDIVGYSFDGAYRRPMLFHAGAGGIDLSSAGVFDPSDVNDRRMLVDHSFTVKRLDLNTMIVEDLGKPPGSYLATTAADINENNQVGGLAILSNGGNCDRVAARYTDGTGWEIFSQCGSGNGITDLNDLGDAVMRLNVYPAVRFEGIGMYDIEPLIDAPVGHWYVVNTGVTINNRRQMVVFATNQATNQAGSLLLTPIGGYSLEATNLVGGTNALFTITGATPDANQYIVYSLRGVGSTFVPQLNVTLDLRSPTLLTSGRADANGAFTRSVSVPHAASGRQVWFQAAERDHTTNVLDSTIK